MRVPASVCDRPRAELRSPDPTANPYLAFSLLIYAGLYGIKNKLTPPLAADINLFKASEELLKGFGKLPASLDEAILEMRKSEFVRAYIPERIIELYGKKLN